MDRQTVGGQLRNHGPADFLNRFLAITDNNNVVDVSDVLPNAQGFLYPVVESIQEYVGE